MIVPGSHTCSDAPFALQEGRVLMRTERRHLNGLLPCRFVIVAVADRGGLACFLDFKRMVQRMAPHGLAISVKAGSVLI